MPNSASKGIGPLRIINRNAAYGGGQAPPTNGLAEYTKRLALMVPSEVTAFYVSMHPFVVGDLKPEQLRNDFAAWVPWICTLLVIIVKAAGTRDQRGWRSVQPVPVLFATVAFMLWVLTLGHYVAIISDWSMVQNSRAIGFIAALFTFGVPYFYRGDPPPKPPAAPTVQSVRSPE